MKVLNLVKGSLGGGRGSRSQRKEEKSLNKGSLEVFKKRQERKAGGGVAFWGESFGGGEGKVSSS